MDLKFEQFYQKKGYKYIFGVDEAGRGSLVGPVTAAAVIINSKIKKQIRQLAEKIQNQNFKEILKILRDSKKLSAKKREKIFKLMKQNPLIDFSWSMVGEKTIDKINVSEATFLAMRRSIEKLKKKIKINPNLILVDGNQKISKLKYPQKTIIKGDEKISSIALASVAAKVIRDKKMVALAKKYPQYKLEIHKGYPTKLHKSLIKKYGRCEIHRRSYKLK